MMNSATDFAMINGHFHDTHETLVALTDRGLCYGDGLFETMLFVDGHIVLQERHLQRLFAGCERLGIALDREAVRKELDSVCARAVETTTAAGGAGVVKLVVTRTACGRGYAANLSAGANRYWQFFSGLSYPAELLEGVRGGIADWRLPINPALAGIKHLNRLDQVMVATSGREPEQVVCSEKGNVVEATASNLFYARDQVLYTPQLHQAGVRGVMRDYIVEEVAPQLGIPVKEKRVTVAELCHADEVFICNSVFGVRPLLAIGIKSFSRGKVTQQMQQHVHELGYAVLYR